MFPPPFFPPILYPPTISSANFIFSSSLPLPSTLSAIVTPESLNRADQFIHLFVLPLLENSKQDYIILEFLLINKETKKREREREMRKIGNFKIYNFNPWKKQRDLFLVFRVLSTYNSNGDEMKIGTPIRGRNRSRFRSARYLSCRGKGKILIPTR